MASFGENLRREREMRGVTLEEICAATKISLRLLQALEASEFPKLPTGIFTRNFIRTYAKYLGLDEERVLAEYHLATQPQTMVELRHMASAQSSTRRGSSRATLVALPLAVVMLAGSYVLYHSRRAAEIGGKVVNSDQVVAAPTSGTAAAATDTGTAAGTETASTPAGATTDVRSGSPGVAGSAARAEDASSATPGLPLAPNRNRVAPARGELVLQVAAKEQTWVAVSADGQTALQRILNPRELKTLKAKESFDIVTGNAQGLVLTLNGETLNSLGGHNAYKKVHLTHDDLKTSTP